MEGGKGKKTVRFSLPPAPCSSTCSEAVSASPSSSVTSDRSVSSQSSGQPQPGTSGNGIDIKGEYKKFKAALWRFQYSKEMRQQEKQQKMAELEKIQQRRKKLAYQIANVQENITMLENTHEYSAEFTSVTELLQNTLPDQQEITVKNIAGLQDKITEKINDVKADLERFARIKPVVSKLYKLPK